MAEYIYIVAGDYICASCHEKLDASDQPFTDEYTVDSIGEVDVPENCTRCNAYLGLKLTTDGVKFALTVMSEYMEQINSGVMINTSVAHSLAEWAEDLRWYGLNEHMSLVTSLYLAWYHRYFKDDDNGADAVLSDDEKQRLESVASRCIRDEHFTNKQMSMLVFTKWLVDAGRLS